MKNNWHTRIAEARGRGYFTEGDKDLVFKWPTCACDKLDSRIPRGPVGEPNDKILLDLGDLFSNEVCLDHFDRAADLLEMVEVREIEIIANIDKAALDIK